MIASLWEEIQKIENEKRHIRDSIEGLLNRISITDDENERNKAPTHISYLVSQYVELSRTTHILYKAFNKELGIKGD